MDATKQVQLDLMLTSRKVLAAALDIAKQKLAELERDLPKWQEQLRKADAVIEELKNS